jgi:hypothetical protein
MAPDRYQCLLRRVLCTRPVPQDSIRDGKEAVGEARDKLVEGVMIASLRAYHQVSLHVSASAWPPDEASLCCMSRGGPPAIDLFVESMGAA